MLEKIRGSTYPTISSIFGISTVLIIESYGILLPILIWRTEKNCSSYREKLLKFKAEGQEFAKISAISGRIWRS